MEFKPLSENAVVIYFGEKVGEANLLHISAFNQALYNEPFIGFIETVPAFVSLTVYFDPVLVMQHHSLKVERAYAIVIQYLRQLSLSLKIPQSLANQAVVNIPVCYDETFGPDLQIVAQHNNISIADVIRIHCAATYIVYMVGFMPGFPYLGGMSSQIAAPRKEVPRSTIPAGTVGIGGEQTGIYPWNSPGGWQLIGRTPVQLFDSKHTPPSLLAAGQTVQFYPIDRETFDSFAV